MEPASLLVEWDLLLRIVVSVGCGALMGSERELRKHAAGLRTIMLICMGACAFTAVGIWLAGQSWADEVQLDPGRLPSYVIAGVGFLGAGPILRRRGRVDGLTTAATIWVAAAVGVILGVGLIGLGLATTVLVLVTVGVMQPLSQFLSQGRTDRALSVRCEGDELEVTETIAYLESFNLRDLEVERVPEGANISFRYHSSDQQSSAMLTGLRRRLRGKPVPDEND